MHNYEVRPRKDKRGVDLVSDAMPFGRLWYGEPNAISNAMSYAKFFSRSQHAAKRERAPQSKTGRAVHRPFQPGNDESRVATVSILIAAIHHRNVKHVGSEFRRFYSVRRVRPMQIKAED